MLATVQRVSEASVIINDLEISSIKKGVLIFVCVEQHDTSQTVKEMINKIYNFKMLDGSKGITSSSLKNQNEDILIVSQFTLFGSIKKGMKPSWSKAADPTTAHSLYNQFIDICKEKKDINIATGVFGADMDINSINDGPFTLVIDTKKRE